MIIQEFLKAKNHLFDNWASNTDENAAKPLTKFIADCETLICNTPIDPSNLGAVFSEALTAAVKTPLNGIIYSGNIDRRSIVSFISVGKRHLTSNAIIIVDNADVMTVYEGIRESILSDTALRFETLHIETEDTRPGRGLAFLSWNNNRTNVQDQSTIPANKNRNKNYQFADAQEKIDYQVSRTIVEDALKKWESSDEGVAKHNFEVMISEFPNQESPTGYWHDANDQDFVDFFTWGHDHHFGSNYKRQGAMSTRHIEIVSESLQYGLLEKDLTGKKVLNIGCWSGGDLLALAGLGGEMTAIEEHKTSAAAAVRLCELLGVEAEITSTSLYDENTRWSQSFDIVYISGVIYHVTDPLLALRICFSYLKPGGRIVLETKASSMEGSFCEYAGTLEKGWNWYAPTRDALGRWLVDAGFPAEGISLHVRKNGRILAGATKSEKAKLPEKSGFSRPSSWLESVQ